MRAARRAYRRTCLEVWENGKWIAFGLCAGNGLLYIRFAYSITQHLGGVENTGFDAKVAGLLGLLCLLWEKDRVNVREDTARGDGDATKELVELLIIADSKSDVARNDA
eukprot:CAMPEP_0183342292 /NCGR_PEP_ID=MMETSP0164_2-20130417/8421_1 /TAXON_ID=221442 /ORGANISM="Coccolithus pelagicus ssp braarudi, Strain PLY182g" /LENGTH=108 /DNA_ID=CAMNT_0025512823 /DNA_START=138 /DNA_END=464 /DNA_ORIENTATION=-